MFKYFTHVARSDTISGALTSVMLVINIVDLIVELDMVSSAYFECR